MTFNRGPYYHRRDPAMGSQSDTQAALAAFLAAPDEGTSERSLERLLAGDLDRVIRGVIRRALGSVARARGAAAEDLEDVRGDVLVLLVRKLRELKTSPVPEPIADFTAYVATVTHHACYGYLRRQYPHWVRLRNQVRYVMNHDADLSLQLEGERAICVCRAAPFDSGGDDPQRLPLRDLAKRLIARTGGRMPLDDLVAAIADLRGVRDTSPRATGRADVEQVPDPRVSAAVDLDNVRYVQRVWMEVGQLPTRQRWALLLNLRGDRGESLLALFTLTGAATIDEIAGALQMPRTELERLWDELPLEDRRLAELLNLSRQQVINLRKSARERLSRRLAAAGSIGAGNMRRHSDFLVIGEGRLRGAS